MTLPAINVTIEDRSFALPTLKTGRSGYVVITGDRGPHNQVVELNSISQFHRIFGTPDLTRTGQGHYMADKFLQHSSRLFVVRPAVTSLTTTVAGATLSRISHATISTNEVVTALAETTYTFTHASNSLTTTTASTAIVGDWILSATDVLSLALARQIVAISTDKLTVTLDSAYLGTTSALAEGASTFQPLTVSTVAAPGIDSSTQLSTTTPGELFHIHAVGTGTYYNDIVVRGVRNTALEKMYTDASGNVLYPNTFMDLYVYHHNVDGTMSLIEGPWTVSLMNKAGNSVIRDLSTGLEMFLPTVVNSKSDYIRIIPGLGITYYEWAANAADLREYTQTLFSSGIVTKTTQIGQNGVGLSLGGDGAQYDMFGRIDFAGSGADAGMFEGHVAQAFNGTLTSIDGTIELIVQSTYPWYEFDYILSGGYSATVQYAAVTLADDRSDCMVIADTGSNASSANADISNRLNLVPWNTYNAMLYVQYREIFDVYTGKHIYITPAYHAIERHLVIDARDWIAEPVAGIEKGAIQEPIVLSYRPPLVKLNDLIDGEMNPVIVEPQGKYILHQLTTWKRLSIMKRGHAVKFIHFIKKEIPKLLKDILQHKATPFWIGMVDRRLNGFLYPFVVGNSSSDRLAAMTSFTVDSTFDEARSEIVVALTVRPIRSIEAINVSIIVV